MCMKIPYPSRTEALADIKYIKAQQIYRSKKHGIGSKKSGRKMFTYRCKWCGKWHLTSKKQK